MSERFTTSDFIAMREQVASLEARVADLLVRPTVSVPRAPAVQKIHLQYPIFTGFLVACGVWLFGVVLALFIMFLMAAMGLSFAGLSAGSPGS